MGDMDGAGLREPGGRSRYRRDSIRLFLTLVAAAAIAVGLSIEW